MKDRNKTFTCGREAACLVALSALLSLTASAQPVITQDPQSCTILFGTTATFTVTATGTPPLAYQWQGDCGILSGCDLTGHTNATLVLTNVATGGSVFYRVVITNIDGAVTSAWAYLKILVPPRITPTTLLQHRAEDIGKKASFAVTASGTEPLAYQWRLDGHELAGQTNRTLTFNAVQPADEGDYTVVVSNLAGMVTSDPLRLWVTPRASSFIKASLTNNLGRLPYFYLLPTNYDATLSYPLALQFHGLGDENRFPVYYATFPALKTLASYRQQERDPVIQLWPSKRAGDVTWTDAYVRQVSALLDQFILRFNVDTNRIYVAGGEEGFHAAWDLAAMRTGLIAGALLAAGEQGNSPAVAVKDVPVWTWCAQDDTTPDRDGPRNATHALREAGGSALYTEYKTGAYDIYDPTAGAILMGSATPAILDWLLAQRRGVPSTAEPLLAITNPTAPAIWSTGATNLSFAGSALALDENVTGVVWTNTANKLGGLATGSNAWTIASVPLAADRTNVVIVTAMTTSWAPACGGNTTFSQTLMVVCSPIQATLTLEGTTALLNWTGGSPPYRIQRATDLTAADWTEVLSEATPPLTLPVTGPSGFYRIVGQ